MDPVTILLVDDEQAHVELEIRAIRKTSYASRIDVVNDGREALDYLANRGKYEDKRQYPTPGLILLDFNLPFMDGPSVLREIKKRPELEKIPVIAVSSHLDTASQVEMLKAGAVDYISKPFQTEELNARIGTHLKMKRMYESMVQADKLYAMGLIAAGISHEIKNRFNTINTALYFIKEKLPEDEKITRSVSCIESEIKRGIKLVGDLHQFSSPRKPYFEPINLDDLIKYALTTVDKQVMSQGIEVIYKGVDPEFPRVMGDPSQIIQVLINLFLNAVEAMGDGGVLRVDLESILIDDEDWVQIQVADTGCGMTEEQAAHIFNPFYTTKASGSGLGLSVSYSIIKEHNANITVSSRPDEGAAFTIQLKVKNNATPQTAAPAAIPATS